MVFRGIVDLVVNPEADRDVGIFSRRADQNLFGAAGQMQLGFRSIGKKSGRFENDIHTQVFPRQFCRIALLKNKASAEEVNAAFKAAASDASYKGVLEFSDEPLVLQDIVGNPHSCIFDSNLTMVLGDNS